MWALVVTSLATEVESVFPPVLWLPGASVGTPVLELPDVSVPLTSSRVVPAVPLLP